MVHHHPKMVHNPGLFDTSYLGLWSGADHAPEARRARVTLPGQESSLSLASGEYPVHPEPVRHFPGACLGAPNPKLTGRYFNESENGEIGIDYAKHQLEEGYFGFRVGSRLCHDCMGFQKTRARQML